jgi:hypothetical protein
MGGFFMGIQNPTTKQARYREQGPVSAAGSTDRRNTLSLWGKDEVLRDGIQNTDQLYGGTEV